MKRIISFLSLILLVLNTTSVFSQSNAISQKSVAGAFFRSLVLPGWGERYAGKTGISKYLIAAEAAGWTGFLGLHYYSRWLEDDYKAFAASHAGVDTDGKKKLYFVDIGNFDNIIEYNDKKRFDRDDYLQYPETDEFAWNWDTDANRKRFEKIRIRSDTYNNRKVYFMSAIFLNHVISAVEAALFAKNAGREDTASISKYCYASSTSSKVLVNFRINF